MHDLLRANDRRVTIEEIQKQVASHFNIRISDMHSARRARSVARPRQVAMYLSKQLTARSLARDWPEVWRQGPYHRDARREKGRRAQDVGSRIRRRYRAFAPDA